MKFLSLSHERRSQAFEQAAAGKDLSPVIMEKDFWVCWLLGLIFSDPQLRFNFVCKGGISLSKVFGVTDRISDEVDLSISPEFVGADAEAFEDMYSRARRDAALAEMQRLCEAKLKEMIEPRLERTIRNALGMPAMGKSWLNMESDPISQTPNLYFLYPATQATGMEHIRREVRIAVESLTDLQPVGLYGLRPWVAEAFPAAFTDWECEVMALELVRTFWEKATMLHAEYHRPGDQSVPMGFVRHYSDLARLLEHAEAASFLADHVLCANVADWKSRVLPHAWARYDLARHGTFKLVPPDHRLAALKQDYEEMRPLFLREPPDFEKMMARLAEAEKRINAPA